MKPEVRKHFQTVDPILFAALETLDAVAHELTPRHSNDYFSELCDAIISQQLSSKAGATIFGRFKALFPEKKITPHKTLELTDEQIREVGASWSKVKFIKDLAQKTVNKEIPLDSLKDLSNEQVIGILTAVKGIGPWTAEMFLMFSLGREDVFSYGDLGLMRGIQRLYRFKKDPTKKQMEKIVKKWSPYRTYASRILWRSLEL
jgi:DNA-3-methyladenine glycosylase II